MIQVIKRGFTNPLVAATLQGAGGAVDLTGRTVYLVLRTAAASEPALTKLATVDPDQEENKGVVRVSLAPESADLALGDYETEWQDWTGGSFVAVYPSATFDRVRLIDPLRSTDPAA